MLEETVTRLEKKLGLLFWMAMLQLAITLCGFALLGHGLWQIMQRLPLPQ